MLSGKNALITGGDKGIGKAILLTFAKNGANVFFTYKADVESAQRTKKEAKKYGYNVESYQMDVTSDSSIKTTLQKIKEEAGNIDILVNNAGIVYDCLFLNADMQRWWKVVDVIFGGTVKVTKEVLRDMLDKEYGRIINIASIAGLIGIAGQTNYTSAKAAIISYTKSLAKELARLGISVNAIAPGYIETDMTSQYSEAEKKQFIKNIPMRRFGKPEDVANAALFLASSMGDYITGKTIAVDGGMI